ncbi:hypothetical protein KM295_06435 [Natronomonas sp. F2-12]|uniref:Transposase n=1 Tax=Natronomonas aquatica TaxID=2841590 RepID=A0A9R1CQD2_9EURY|nr:hypothetical protein [Natronomonas aquatica]MCQ4333128.1 hypothetical protein [Natronomonas aquatica]
MEDVLALYHEPYDETRPVVYFDESNKELHKEVRDPLPAARERSLGTTTPTNGMAHAISSW